MNIPRWLTYLILALCNALLLGVLAAASMDRLEGQLNGEGPILEFGKIIAFTFLGWLVIVLLSGWIGRKSSPVKMAALIMLLVSSCLYIVYSVKIVDHRIVHRASRAQLASKISEWPEPQGTKAVHLTPQEYAMVATYTGFPELPSDASSISYSYRFDGFLPDYTLDLSYYVPSEEDIDSYHTDTNGYTGDQRVQLIGAWKKVSHEEIQR